MFHEVRRVILMRASPRNRVVVFRLSQEEYRSLKLACSQRGARNVSDFTRNEILDALQAAPLDELIQPGFERIEQRLAELRSAIVSLALVMEEMKYVDGTPKR